MIKKALIAACALTLLSGCCGDKMNHWGRGGYNKMHHDHMVGSTIHFDLNSAAITPAGAKALKKQVEWLKENPDYMAKIEGHADARGTKDYNLALGEKRAMAVKHMLVKHGIAAERLSTISYGKEKPAVMDHNEEAWKQNRRAVVVLMCK